MVFCYACVFTYSGIFYRGGFHTLVILNPFLYVLFMSVCTSCSPRVVVHVVVLWAGCVQVAVVVCVLLLLVLAFAYAQSLPASGSVSAAEQHNWSSPLSHIRLLSLPIAKKYNLHGKRPPPLDTRRPSHAQHYSMTSPPRRRNTSGTALEF